MEQTANETTYCIVGIYMCCEQKSDQCVIHLILEAFSADCYNNAFVQSSICHLTAAVCLFFCPHVEGSLTERCLSRCSEKNLKLKLGFIIPTIHGIDLFRMKLQ